MLRGSGGDAGDRGRDRDNAGGDCGTWRDGDRTGAAGDAIAASGAAATLTGIGAAFAAPLAGSKPWSWAMVRAARAATPNSAARWARNGGWHS